MKRRAIILLIGLLGVAGPPLLEAQTTETHTFTTNRVVPDGDPSGLAEVRSVSSVIDNITALKVRLKVAGEFNGDLYGFLQHTNGFTVLLNRPGKTAAHSFGYDDSGFNVTFEAGAANGDIHLYRNVTTPSAGSPLTGTWQPDGRTNDPVNVTDADARVTSLTNFHGLNADGDWALYLVDTESGGTNMLTEWELEIVGAATPTLAWSNPADIGYGTALSGTHLNATATFNATNVPGTFTYTPASGTVLNAGSGQTLSVTFTPDDTNTFLAVATTATVNVARAPLSITAVNTNKVYGAALPTLAASYSGFVNGDDQGDLDTGVSLTTTAGASSPVANYTITASGAADANYIITHVNGSLSVTPADLTIIAENKSKVYGAALPVFTATYSGFVNGDSAASLDTPVSLATAADASSPVGSYDINASGAADANYTIAHAKGTLTVTTAPLTITANSTNRVYGAPNPSFTASYAGFVNGDDEGDLDTPVSLTTAANAASGVGSYPITAANAADANYAITHQSGTLTIGQASTTGAVTSSANPAVPGATVTLTMTLTPVAPSAGTPTGSVNFRIDGNIAGSGTLSGGAATFALNTLALGSHTVVAEYAGSTDFVGTTNTLSPNLVINTPPDAVNDTIERYLTGTVKVRLSTLLGNDSDADTGDMTSATAVVSSTSANGGTVTVSGAWVYYTPPAGFTNVDSFTYTLTDSRGGSDTATVTVALATDTTPTPNLVITNLGGGSVRIDGHGIPGRTYRLQYTDTLTPATWQDLPGGSVTPDSTGAFSVTDAQGASRFYRTVWP